MFKPNDSRPALYIGRFQPFHVGHLDAIKQIIEKEKSDSQFSKKSQKIKLIIAIGSAEKSGTKENPWSVKVRKKMIDGTLKELKKIYNFLYVIIPIPDIHNDEKWVAHVEKRAPEFSRVYTGSPIVKKLFKKNNRHEVVTLRKRIKVNGTQIRKMFTKNKAQKKRNSEWKKYVSKPVKRQIESLIHRVVPSNMV